MATTIAAIRRVDSPLLSDLELIPFTLTASPCQLEDWTLRTRKSSLATHQERRSSQGFTRLLPPPGRAMKALFALMLAAIAPSMAFACEPVPSSWKLSPPSDATALHRPEHPQPGSVHDEQVTAIFAAMRPGEKLTPYSDFHTYKDGRAGGTSGYALIRNGCLIRHVFMVGA